jgi:Mrp family chromosome partitioning ATPase
MTSLDQAFIKAYKHLGPAGQSATKREGSTAPEIRVEAAKVETPTPDGDNPIAKNIAEVLAFAPPHKAEQAKPKPAQKGKKKIIPAPVIDKPGAKDVVYRLDPPCPSLPEAPRASSFRSPPREEYSDSRKTLRVDGPRQDAPPAGPAPDSPQQGIHLETSIRVFQPMLQVDHFAWPKICHRLESLVPMELDRLAETLLSAGKRGMKVIGLSGSQRGCGATTLLLCAARRLASRQVKTVIVDADLSDPQLAKRLGLLPQLGWEHIAAGQQPVEEVLIESANDNLAVLPLCAPLAISEISYASHRLVAESLNTLRNNYDLILMDLGPLENPQSLADLTSGGLNCRIDAMIVVHKVGKVLATCLPAVRQSLEATGITVVGVIENFVQNATAPEDIMRSPSNASSVPGRT